MKILSTASALAALMAMTTVVEAKELRFAIGYPPNSAPVKVMEDYAAKVSELTGGELTVKVFPSSLLSFPETSPGVRDGIADMGLLATGYHPTEYPINNLVPNTTIQMIDFGDAVKGREAMAFASALTEYTLLHCPKCNAEFEAQNQVFNSIASTSAYYLMCNKPIGSVDALSGLRMRAPSNWARWTAYVGGNPMSIPLGEMNEAMSQGVLDCLVASAAEIVNWNLTSLVSDIAVGVPGGVAAGAPVNINRDTWQSLTSQERQALMRAGAFSQAQYAWAFQEAEADALEAAKAAGANVADAHPSIVEKTKEFVVKDTAAMLEEVANKYGIQDGGVMLESFATILTKWVDLAQDIDTVESFEEVLWTEIFSKVDVDAHGF